MPSTRTELKSKLQNAERALQEYKRLLTETRRTLETQKRANVALKRVIATLGKEKKKTEGVKPAGRRFPVKHTLVDVLYAVSKGKPIPPLDRPIELCAGHPDVKKVLNDSFKHCKTPLQKAQRANRLLVYFVGHTFERPGKSREIDEYNIATWYEKLTGEWGKIDKLVGMDSTAILKAGLGDVSSYSSAPYSGKDVGVQSKAVGKLAADESRLPKGRTIPAPTAQAAKPKRKPKRKNKKKNGAKASQRVEAPRRQAVTLEPSIGNVGRHSRQVWIKKEDTKSDRALLNAENKKPNMTTTIARKPGEKARPGKVQIWVPKNKPGNHKHDVGVP
jgi:hypothetical protein